MDARAAALWSATAKVAGRVARTGRRLRAQANAVRENGLSPWGLRALAKTAVNRLYRDSRRLPASKQPASRPVMGKQHCFVRSPRTLVNRAPIKRFARPCRRPLMPPGCDGQARRLTKAACGSVARGGAG